CLPSPIGRSIRSSRLACLTKGKVNALGAQYRMGRRLYRHDAVISQAIITAPYRDIAMTKPHSGGSVCPFVSAKQKGCRHAERYGDNGGGKIPFVLILVQRHSRAGQVAVEQARIRFEMV